MPEEMTKSMYGHKSGSELLAPLHSEWTGLLSHFPLAPPELLARRELRRRTDSKYVISTSAAADLITNLTADYAVLSAGSELVAMYRTLYFDTPELAFFHAHRRGRRVRHKVRIRHYLDRRISVLEVKSRRSDLLTTKIFRPREYSNNDLTADDQAFVRAQSGVSGDVVPQVWTRFRRLTFLGLRGNERVTVDLDLGVEMRGQRRILPSIAIVEIKQWPFCRSTPVMAALRALGERPCWASKYCAAIAWTRPNERRNTLLPGLAALERRVA